MENPSEADEDSLLAVGVAMGVAIILVVDVRSAMDNERGDCGGRGRRRQWQQEAGMAGGGDRCFIGFSVVGGGRRGGREREERMCSSIQMT